MARVGYTAPMSRSKHHWNHKGNKEYWKSRHHRHGEVPGRKTKTPTHRKERREGKEEPAYRLYEWGYRL